GGGAGLGANADSAFGNVRLTVGAAPAAAGSLTLLWPTEPPAEANGIRFAADWAGTLQQVKPAGPTISLDFMIPGTLPVGTTFTRNSVATYFDATGTMQTATANIPRWP